MAEKEKYISEALLSEQPKKKIGLVLGPGVVTTPKIADTAVTMPKLGEDVIAYLESLEHQIVSSFQIIDCGEWVNGALIPEPTPRYGIYYHQVYRPEVKRTETHDVWHNGARWRCLVSQPSEDNGNLVYHEPVWGSPYWQKMEGIDYSMELTSSKGYFFYKGAVDSMIYPSVFYANEDITAQLPSVIFNWTRYTEQGQSEADILWGTGHRGVKNLHLTNADMPANWASDNRAFFVCTATIIINDNRIQVEQILNF